MSGTKHRVSSQLAAIAGSLLVAGWLTGAAALEASPRDWRSLPPAAAGARPPPPPFDRMRWVSLGVDVGLPEGMQAGLRLGPDLGDPFDEDADAAIAPYVAAILTESFSVDLSLGPTDLGRRYQDEVVEPDGGWFYASSARFGQEFGDWRLAGLVGVIWEEELAGGQLGLGQVGRLRIGGELAYAAGTFEPFLSARFRHTRALGATPGADRNDALLGVGVRYFGESGLSGALQYNTSLGRDVLEAPALRLIIRAEF